MKTKPKKKVVKVKKVSARKSPAKKTVKRSIGKAKPPKRTARKPAGKATKRHVKGKSAAKKPRPPRSSKARERANARAVLAQRLTHAPEPAAVPERKTIPKYPVLPWADSDRVRVAATALKEAARKGLICDWRINLAHTRSANLYLGSDLALENDQRTTREDVIITVYRKLEGGMMGEAQVPMLVADPIATKTLIAHVATLASATRKLSFELPEPVEGLHFPHGYDQHLLDAFNSGEGCRVARHVLDDLRAQLTGIKDVKLAAAEVLTSASAIRVINSRGVDVSFHRTAVYLDLTMMSKSKTDEQEFHWTASFASPEQLNLRTTIPREAQRARDSLLAAQAVGFTGSVLLSDEALRDYFCGDGALSPIVLHSHARFKAMGISRLEPGKPIGTFSGEPFTLTSNPTLPLGAFSMPVDEEGVPLHALDLVRTGVFQQWVAGPRYAAELGVPVTGNVANVQVSAGATREDYLRGNRYVEIVSFSWFNPDAISGDYSAEVRLGYVWENGRATPFRGGHLVGNVFSDLCDARFSREVMHAGRYYGPRAVLLRNGNLTRGV